MGLVPLEHRDIHKDFSYSLTYEPGNPLNPLIKAIAILLLEPALILVWAPWKKGKTDFSLLMGEIALANEIVGDVKTNIDNDTWAQISDMQTLTKWLHSDGLYSDMKELIKLYIFDELNVHAPARRSMTKKNVALETILPEVSKAKARMILICQNPKEIDKILKDKTWLKGGFEKVSLGTAKLFCPKIRLRPIRIGNIPPSHIQFDPYTTAPMTLYPDVSNLEIENIELNQLYMYARGLIGARDIHNHPQKWVSHVRKWLGTLIEFYINHNSQLAIMTQKNMATLYTPHKK
jgi:hypothetical protein